MAAGSPAVLISTSHRPSCRVRVVADGLERARLPLDVLEREQKPTALLAEAERLAVEEQLDLVRARDDVDVLRRARLVVPVADDVRARSLDIDPAVPHHLVGEEAVLREPHRVDLAAAAVVLRAAMVGVGVGEDDVDAAGADARAGAGPLAPVVVPAHDVLDRVRVLVAVVGAGVLRRCAAGRRRPCGTAARTRPSIFAGLRRASTRSPTAACRALLLM